MDPEKPPFHFRNLSDATSPLAPFPAAATQRLLDSYRPWRKARHIAKELGLAPEAAWRFIKQSRIPGWRSLDPRQENGDPFGICLGPHLFEPLHRIDRATGGGGPAAITSEKGPLFDPLLDPLLDEDAGARFRIRNLMDEAAESSIIEGASTTRKDAVDLLRSGREPKTRGERMVANNYLAMQSIKSSLDQPLSLNMLLDLQATLTRDAIDVPDAVGRFRRPDENVRIVDTRDDQTIFVPPHAAGLPDRLQTLCEFANRAHTGPDFVHPVIKACILHFLIGYEHPFVDGNGRTARAVFYWFALRHGYTIFEYLTISEIIRKGTARYPQAYMDTEQDDGDLTYFVLYHLDIIEQALDRLAEHLRHEDEKLKRGQQLLKLSKDLNLRQRLLLEHAIRHPTTEYTVKSHKNSNALAPATARADLDGLVRKRLFTTTKRAKEVIYHPAPGLRERLAKKGL